MCPPFLVSLAQAHMFRQTKVPLLPFPYKIMCFILYHKCNYGYNGKVYEYSVAGSSGLVCVYFAFLNFTSSV